MKRIETIKNRNTFNNIIQEGKYKKNDLFVLYIDKTDNYNKYGIAVSKKYGTAVERNRIKRQIRSIIDNNKNLFKKGFNYIIMVRKNCKKSSYSILENALKELLK